MKTMRMTTKPVCCVVSLVLLVAGAGCGGGQSAYSPALTGQEGLDARATLAIVAAREEAAIEETRRAVQATQVAEGATAQAIQAAAATTSAQETVVAVEATQAAALVTATWGDLLIQQEQYAIIATATADASALAFQEQQGALALARRQAEIERTAMWTRLWPWLVVIVVLTGGVALVLVAASWAIERWRRTRPQRAGDVWVMVGPGGPVALNRPPAVKASSPAVAGLLPAGDPTVASTRNDAAWKYFAQHRSSTRVLLGMESGARPILLDTQASPHLFIAGSSRRGKTTGGLVPYVAWALTVGFNVVLLGERAADFGSFYEHCNVTNLRAFSDEERVELTQAALEAARREMERRDQVLHAAGLNTWREMMQLEPDEAGAILIAIDEFLALATMGGTAVHRSMMQNVASLTSQAGKFGIGLVLAATDPRREALGPMGYLAIKQCARMAFGFNDRGSSRSVLGDDAAFNLPQGAFIYEGVAGGRQRGVAFRPSGDNVRALLAARPVEARGLPEALSGIAMQGAVTVSVWGGTEGRGDVIAPPPASAEADTDPLQHGMQTPRGFVAPSEVERILEGGRMGLPHYQIEMHAFGKQGGAHYYMTEAVLSYYRMSVSTTSTAEVEW